MKKTLFVLLSIALTWVTGVLAAAPPRDDIPETVLITFRPKAGAEAELARVIAEHWTTVRRLDLVQADPHVTVQTKDDAKRPCFVDIFTWRDEDIPDNAPPALLTIWADMNRLTESRGEKPGIEITRVTLTSTR